MQRPRVLRILATAAAIAGILTLAGCLPLLSGSTYSDLDRERTASDSLPPGLPDYAFQDVETSTIRLVAQYDGVDVYLARGTESPVCVLAYPDDDTWISGCGASGLGVRGPVPPTYVVSADGAGWPDNADPISENVAVLVQSSVE